MTNYQLIQSDIIKWSQEYTGPKFHALICDPPYHLTSIVKRFSKPGSKPAKAGVYNRGAKGFMGQTWDGGGVAFQPETWAALGEHLYPGGFIMAFAGTRGYHRMACAMEDAGFIIHPAMIWVNCQGFPKATSISNQIDKAAGVEREVVGNRIRLGDKRAYPHIEGLEDHKSKGTTAEDGYRKVTAPATPLAQAWQGHRYGLQALKPALEFITVAQKPYEGRPVSCITTTGAGALNIDGGRIGTGNSDDYGRSPNRANGTRSGERGFSWGEGLAEDNGIANDLGRWPANLLLDEAGAELLDRQSGILTSGGSAGMRNQPKTGAVEFGLRPQLYQKGEGIDPNSGGASRMFFQSDWQYEVLEQLENADPLHYEPKVSTTEREAGLDNLPERLRHRVNAGGLENEPRFAPVKLKNHHPTLKPISLAKYLATLLLPPEAYAPRRILVPFAGTGSEGIGCALAGWEEVVMIEGSAEYIPIAEARLAWWSRWPGWGQRDVDKILESRKPGQEQQLSFIKGDYD